MMTIQTIQSENEIHVKITYAKSLRRKDVDKIFPNEKAIEAFIDSQIRDFIISTIVSYAKQRQFALAPYMASNMIIKLRGAVSKIITEMELHSSSALVVVQAAVWWLEKEIRLISPSHSSRFRKHFENVIWPLVEQCRAESASARIKMKSYKH